MNYLTLDKVSPDNTLLLLAGRQNLITQYALKRLKTTITDDQLRNENIIDINQLDTLDDLDEILKEPPFIGAYYLLTGDYSLLGNKAKKRLLKEIRRKPKHLRAVLTITSFKDYRDLTKVDDINVLYMFRISNTVYHMYMTEYLNKPISKKVYNLYKKRSNDYSNFVLYLDALKRVNVPITPEVVKANVPDCRTYTLDDYIMRMLGGDTKTTHIKALNDVLKVYKRKSHSEILNKLKQLVHLKRLSMQGYFVPAFIKEDLQELTDKEKLPEELQTLSARLIGQYMTLLYKMSIQEINLIYLTFLKTKPTTQNLFILTDIIYNRKTSSHLIFSIATGKLRLE